MTLRTDIEADVKRIFADKWLNRDGQVVPQAEDLKLGNEGVHLDGTVLYADLSGSTNMVDRLTPEFAAEVYKAYLLATAKVIKSEEGEIVAYDGDRVMAVFIGSSKNTSAVRCAFKVNWIVKNAINPAIKAQYPSVDFAVRQVVGIDTSSLLAARTGVRGANDLVWVGKAANYAAKLTELSADYPTWITHRIYDNMHNSVKTTSNGASMWEERSWTPMDKLRIYRSTFWWSVS
jgi:class 3 adenylate cyclase